MWRGEVVRHSTAFEVRFESSFKGRDAAANLRWDVFSLWVPVRTADVQLLWMPGLRKSKVTELNFCVQVITKAIEDEGGLAWTGGKFWGWAELEAKAKDGSEVFWRSVVFTQVVTRWIREAGRNENNR